MASLQTQYFFPHFPPPPSPTGTPPSPPHFVSPPPPATPRRTRPSSPPPYTIPPPTHAIPPPPHAVPPPPHTVPPPPPHIVPQPPPPPHIIPPPPPSPPGNHTTIIVVVSVSCGGVFFLAFVMAALWCFLKKKKMVHRAENMHIDEHRKVTEKLVQGLHGTETVMLSVEDDIHIEEDKRKSDVENFRKGLHLHSGDKYIAGLVDAAGEPSSSSGHHHHQKP